MKRLLWVLFWTSIATTVCSAQTTLYLPQVADGQVGGFAWESAIVVTNPAAPGTAAASGTVTFTRDDGSAYNLALTDERDQPVTVTAGAVPFQISGGQTRLFVSTGLAPTVSTGFATVTSNLPVVAGVVFFEFTATGTRVAEAGVAAATPLTQQGTIAVKDNGDTGVAMANPGTASATVTFQLLDTTGAAALPSVNRTVAAKNHLSFFISELFPSLPKGFFGTMRVTSNVPLVSTTLIFESDGKFATLPVFPLQ